MLDGFHPGRAAKPITGVFDFVGGHGRALCILFEYTVIEVRHFRESEATESGFCEWLNAGEVWANLSGEDGGKRGIVGGWPLDSKAFPKFARLDVIIKCRVSLLAN